MEIGLVLSGGGARGFAHAGVIKALQEFGITINEISGVSAGSVIGAYYAAGFSIDEIISVTKRLELFRVIDVRLLRPGLFRLNSIRKGLNTHLKGISFDQLNIPLTVTATDFENGLSCFINSGNVVEAILASSAIPALFDPVAYEGRKLVDGGLLNNFPVEPLQNKKIKIIGVHVNPVGKVDVSRLKIPSVIERSLNLAISNEVKARKNECNVFIEPPELSDFGVFDFDDADQIVSIGYQHTMKMKNEIEHKILEG